MGSGFILSFHKYGAVSPLSVIGSARHTVFLPFGAGGVMQLAEEPQLLKKKGGERNSTLFTQPERTGDRADPSVILGTSDLL